MQETSLTPTLPNKEKDLNNPKTTNFPQQNTYDFARQMGRLAQDKKALDLKLYDVSDLTSYTDAVLICSGSSARHCSAIAEWIREEAKGRFGRKPLGIEGVEQAQWLLLDYGELVVHIFQEPVREFYELDRLWNGAPLLELSSPSHPIQNS